MQKLNQSQQSAVHAPIGPALVLAGAGSGKTRVLTNRIIHLVKDCGVMPRNILAITFTNKAAGEMKRRLLEWDDQAQYMTISTIHSFCAMALRQESEWLQRSNNFTIYVDEDKKSLLKKVIKDYVEDANANTISEVANVISMLKNNAVSPSDCQGQLDKVLAEEVNPKTVEEIGIDSFREILLLYSQRLADNNAMDFDDLLFFVHQLFSKCPLVLQRYQDRYQHILIDEFQDTNKVQYEIFRMLASEHKSIFVVGDDDQSIYSWRGADIGNILNFEKHFDNVNVYKLEQNYRSTKRILDVANTIISVNTERFDKKLWTDNDNGVKVELFSGYNEQEEAYYVVSQIKSLIAHNGNKLRDFAILMRLNALTRSFEQQLNKEGIPYKVFGGFKFFDRKEVKDVIAYLRIVNNRYDNEACIRCFNEPYRRGIGDKTVEKLSYLSTSEGMPILDILANINSYVQYFNKGTVSKLMDFYNEYLHLYDKAQGNNVAVVLLETVKTMRFREFYQEMGDDERLRNIDELEQSVLDYVSANANNTVGDYLQSVSLVVDKDDYDNSQYVTLATIHAVKGLEYNNVFVVGVERDTFPSARSAKSYKSTQEERRLMYVATTRARKRLYITCATSRYMYGNRQSKLPSTYFSEVRTHLANLAPNYGQSLCDDVVVNREVRNTSGYARQTNAKVANKNIGIFKIGQKVSHPTFGQGVILMIKGEFADIVFATYGKKTISLSIAPLSIVQ